MNMSLNGTIDMSALALRVDGYFDVVLAESVMNSFVKGF